MSSKKRSTSSFHSEFCRRALSALKNLPFPFGNEGADVKGTALAGMAVVDGGGAELAVDEVAGSSVGA